MTRAHFRVAVIVCAAALVGCESKPEPNSYTLEGGSYTLLSKVEVFRHGEKTLEDRRADPVRVNINGDEVTIVGTKNQNDPIVGVLSGGAFTAEINSANGTIRFEGALTADNRLEGAIIGKTADAKQTVEGTWTLEPRKE